MNFDFQICEILVSIELEGKKKLFRKFIIYKHFFQQLLLFVHFYIANIIVLRSWFWSGAITENQFSQIKQNVRQHNPKNPLEQTATNNDPQFFRTTRWSNRLGTMRWGLLSQTINCTGARFHNMSILWYNGKFMYMLWTFTLVKRMIYQDVFLIEGWTWLLSGGVPPSIRHLDP